MVKDCSIIVYKIVTMFGDGELIRVNTHYSWICLWDWALGYGTKGTKTCQRLVKLMTKPIFGDWLCLACNKKIDDAHSTIGSLTAVLQTQYH